MSKRANKPRRMEDYDDPELGDENDPEYREELFLSMKEGGVSPEEIRTDPKMKAEYAEWLKANPS